MTRRIIQDVVFPSKRGKEETKTQPPIFPTSPKILPVKDDTSGNFVGTSAMPAQEKIHQDTQDFLPPLIKKTNSPIGSSTAQRFRSAGEMEKENSSSTKAPRIILWTLALLTCFGLTGVVLSAFFSGATVKIVPLNKTVPVNLDFTAQEETPDHPMETLNKANPSVIVYQKIPLPILEKSEDVPATIEKKITRKASGKVKIFNEYSTASQRLIKNTRFESSSGKIYRIDNSVVVPGMTVANGKIFPGSIDVVVYGDAPGEEYNGGATDFVIPGFKGDPRYGKFYARSQTPLEGGFSGTIKVPTPEDQKAAVDRLKEALKNDLTKKARAQIPDGYILYDNAMFIVYDDLKTFDTENPSHVTVKGSLYGVMFNKKVLSNFIAKKTISSYNGEPVLIRNIADLTLTPKGEILDPAHLGDVDFNISGNAFLVWDVDREALKKELAGASKQEQFKTIIIKYTSIAKAEAIVRPFWKMNFPQDPQKIAIEEVLK